MFSQLPLCPAWTKMVPDTKSISRTLWTASFPTLTIGNQRFAVSWNSLILPLGPNLCSFARLICTRPVRFRWPEASAGQFYQPWCCSGYSLSRDSVHISSANVEDKPAVDTRYFLHPLDLDIMAYNLLDVEKLHKVEPLSQCPKLNGRS